MSDNPTPTPQDLVDEATRNWAVGVVIQSRQSADGEGSRPILTTFDAMYVSIAADVLANYVKSGLQQASVAHEQHKSSISKLKEEAAAAHVE